MAVRCAVCLSRGAEIEALPGEQLCRIHKSDSHTSGMVGSICSPNSNALSPALIRPQLVQDPLSTGITQALDGSGNSRSTSSAGVYNIASCPGLANRQGWLTLQRLQDFVEQEVLSNFDIILPAQTVSGQGTQDLQLVPLCTWDALSVVLKKLAYDSTSKCPWSRLGIGAMEGHDPSEMIIQARAETARLLCEHTASLTLASDELDRATEAASAFADARKTCTAQLSDVLRERKKLKAGKLPWWKEFGHKALGVISDTKADAQEQCFTQWSNLLGAPSEAAQVSTSRAAATLLEKGDGKFWDQMGSTPFLAWCPADINALSRTIATYIRRAQTQPRPTYFRLAAPLNLLPGMSSVDKVLDFWQHPLLGDKWASVVKDVAIYNTPLEMVLPGGNGPKHTLQGMVIFTIALQGARELPKIVEIEAPLYRVPEIPCIFVDTPPQHLGKVISVLSTPQFSSISYRAPYRSPGSQPNMPRLRLDLLLPSHMSELEQTIVLANLRGEFAGIGIVLGHKNLFGQQDALICEMNAPSAVGFISHLCCQFIFLSPDKAILKTNAALDAWQPVLDDLMHSDPESAVTRVRWKASTNGGRPWCSPQATPAQLAAVRRRRGRGPGSNLPSNYVADIRLSGEVGSLEDQVLSGLMEHAVTQTGLHLRKAASPQQLRPGEWINLRFLDEFAAAGRIRVALDSQQEVDLVIHHLHERCIDVGGDKVAITVHSDLKDAVTAMGNDRQRWGSAGAASA